MAGVGATVVSGFRDVGLREPSCLELCFFGGWVAKRWLLPGFAITLKVPKNISPQSSVALFNTDDA